MYSLFVIIAALLIVTICMGLPAIVIMAGVKGLNNITDDIRAYRMRQSYKNEPMNRI